MAHVGNSRPSLGNPATGAAEQLVALKFLLHFVGDLHQPLHAADDHDAGGNKKLVAGERVHRGNTTGMSSSWSGWELTRVEWRQI